MELVFWMFFGASSTALVVFLPVCKAEANRVELSPAKMKDEALLSCGRCVRVARPDRARRAMITFVDEVSGFQADGPNISDFTGWPNKHQRNITTGCEDGRCALPKA